MLNRQRASRRGVRTILIAIAMAIAIPAFATGSAQAGSGYFCGSPSGGAGIPNGSNCTGSAYHSNFDMITANTLAGGNACAARSSTPGSLTVVGYSCTGGALFSAYQCAGGCGGGYGSIWNRSGGFGTYYGWYNYI